MNNGNGNVTDDMKLSSNKKPQFTKHYSTNQLTKKRWKSKKEKIMV
jgi:hypothetical protein